jgi:hypothetical protein
MMQLLQILGFTFTLMLVFPWIYSFYAAYINWVCSIFEKERHHSDKKRYQRQLTKSSLKGE